MIVFFFVLVGVGLSIVAAAQDQSLIQRAQTPVLSACPAGARIFGTPAILNSVECTIADATGAPIRGYYVCSNGYVYVPANPTLGTPGLCLDPNTVPACPTGVISVENGTPNSYRCSSQNLVISACSQGYYPDNINDGVVRCVSQSASCRVDQCYWGDTGTGVFCRESNAVLGCAVGGCTAGQQLKCSNGKLSCETNVSACPVTSATPVALANNCPSGVCVYKDPASSASYACGMAGLMPGNGSCSNINNTCCVTSTYVAKCSWDASKPENICTRDGVNRLYVGGKPTRPACCGGLTENGQGTCECKTVTATPVSTSPLTPTTTPKPTPQLSSTCSAVAFVDGFNDTNLSTKFRVLGSGSVRSGVRISSANAPVNNALELSIQPTNVSQSISAVGIETVQLVQGVFSYKLNLHKFLTSGQPFTFMADNGKATYGVRIENGGNKETYKLTSEQRTTGTNLVSGQQTYYLSASTRPVLFIERTGGGTIRVGYTVGAASPVVMQTFTAISGDFKAKLTLAGPTSTVTLDRFTSSCL